MEITSVPHIMIMYPYRVFTKFRFTMISYTATCMATAGSSAAKVNALRIRPLPGNLKRFSTYASCGPMIMDTASTTTRTIRELRNATSIFAFVNAFTEMVSDKYHISGKYNILSQPEFQDVGKVREFLNAIEKKDILRIVKSDSMGISIKIGQENELKVMQDCTVITVPYETNSGSVGAITVFGPTRMEYDKVIPLLEYIAKNMKRIV